MRHSVFCCECNDFVESMLVNGETVYPHRKDLYSLKFWQCPNCNNFVGTHKNSKDNMPLGVIANQEIKNLRIKLHSILDPLWESGKFKRKDIYDVLSKKMHRQYHTAKLRTHKEFREAIGIINKIKEGTIKILIEN